MRYLIWLSTGTFVCNLASAAVHYKATQRYYWDGKVIVAHIFAYKISDCLCIEARYSNNNKSFNAS